MKLARKMTAGLVLVAVAVISAQAAMQSRREMQRSLEDMKRDHLQLGNGLAGAIAKAWQTDGEERALQLLREAGKHEGAMRLRWRWLEELPIGEDQRAALRRGDPVTTRRIEGDDEFLVTLVPVSIGGRAGAIEVSKSLASLLRGVALQAWVTAAWAGGLVLAFVVLAAWMGRRFVGRPVDQLVALADRVGRGDFAIQVNVPAGDELGLLADRLNGMAGALARSRNELEEEQVRRLATQKDLEHAQRLATVGKLAAGIAHELGTPLNVAATYGRMIGDGSVTGPEVQASAGIVVGQIESMTRIIRQLLDFGRSQKSQRRLQSLPELVAASVSLLQPLARKRQVALSVEEGDGQLLSFVDVDGPQFQQVLTNLIMNAVQASARSGRVGVELRSAELPAPENVQSGNTHWVTVSVRDDGVGIEGAVLPHIFEPFFTTKSVGEGTGLGLSVAWGIVRDHGGWIGVESRAGEGSCFTIYLPRASENV